MSARTSTISPVPGIMATRKAALTCARRTRRLQAIARRRTSAILKVRSIGVFDAVVGRSRVDALTLGQRVYGKAGVLCFARSQRGSDYERLRGVPRRQSEDGQRALQCSDGGDAWQGIPMPGAIGQPVPTHATTEFPVGRARRSQATTGLPPGCSSPPQDAAY
jgi:hypothetical protein